MTPLYKDVQERIPLVGVGAKPANGATTRIDLLRAASCVSDPKVNNKFEIDWKCLITGSDDNFTISNINLDCSRIVSI